MGSVAKCMGLYPYEVSKLEAGTWPTKLVYTLFASVLFQIVRLLNEVQCLRHPQESGGDLESKVFVLNDVA